jgi:hypothetical protein
LAQWPPSVTTRTPSSNRPRALCNPEICLRAKIPNKWRTIAFCFSPLLILPARGTRCGRFLLSKCNHPSWTVKKFFESRRENQSFSITTQRKCVMHVPLDSVHKLDWSSIKILWSNTHIIHIEKTGWEWRSRQLSEVSTWFQIRVTRYRKSLFTWSNSPSFSNRILIQRALSLWMLRRSESILLLTLFNQVLITATHRKTPAEFLSKTHVRDASLRKRSVKTLLKFSCLIIWHSGCIHRLCCVDQWLLSRRRVTRTVDLRRTAWRPS